MPHRSIQNGPDGTDAVRWAKLREETDLDQGMRSLRSSLFYPISLVVVAATTPYYHDMPWLLWSGTVSIVGAVVLRVLLMARRKTMYHLHVQRWLAWLTISIPMISVPIGALCACVIYRYGIDQWMFTVTMIWVCATGAGAVITYIPNVLMVRLHLLPMFAPSVFVCFWLRDSRTVALGLCLLFFVGFLVAQLGWLHRAYWRQVADRAMETERLREVESARRAAEAANEAKTRFLANVSHEIRTPMHGVLGMTELVLNTAVTAEQREYLFALRRSASSLLEIVNDLLDLSKIEAEKIQLEPEVFDVRSMIEDVRMTLAPQSDAKRIRLETRVGPEVPLAIVGDALRLRQVLVNLGRNAIKVTESGFARIQVQLQQVLQGQARLTFAVEDSGIDIRTEKRENIFAAFSQPDSSISRRFGGTGLGLSIASQLVRLMDSEIIVESQEGVGSVFSFCCTFPIGEIDEPALPAKPAARPSGAPLHILVAEDNPVNQLVVVRLLKAQGHAVVVAGTGAEAVQEVSSRNFDLVLMDNQMPELSGIEAAIRIREMGYSLPIVALSASAMAGDRERFLAAGMNGYLAKPFHADKLYAEMDRVLMAVAAGQKS